MKMKKIYLTSRGLNTIQGRKMIQSALPDEDRSRRRILLITMAEYEINDILAAACMDMGFSADNVVIYDRYHHVDLRKEFHYIYVSEGNTFEILYMMKRHGLVPLILDSMRKGAVYIGSSAGAMIAGTDICLAKDFDRNFVRMTDFTALELFEGTVIPHYTKEQFERYYDKLGNYWKERYQQIYYVPDDGIIEM